MKHLKTTMEFKHQGVNWKVVFTDTEVRWITFRADNGERFEISTKLKREYPIIRQTAIKMIKNHIEQQTKL